MKIYNVNMVKTEMANFVEIKNPFGSLQTNPEADAWWVRIFFVFEKSVCWYTLIYSLFQSLQSQQSPQVLGSTLEHFLDFLEFCGFIYILHGYKYKWNNIMGVYLIGFSY